MGALSWMPAALASSGEAPACGYELPPALVEHARGRVPLLVRAASNEDATNTRLVERRRRSLEQHSSSRAHCPATVAFLEAILERLLRDSALEGFAGDAPRLELVVQCSHQRGLPVARVAPGKLLIVPGTLTRDADSEDSVAAVLAHEIAHLSLRHSERAIAARGSRSRAPERLKNVHEREADITGLRILVNAGYDPWAAVDHLRKVDAGARRGRPTSNMSLRPRAHDPAEVRIVRLRAQIEACSYRTAGPRRAISAIVRRESSSTTAADMPPTQPALGTRSDESPSHDRNVPAQARTMF